MALTTLSRRQFLYRTTAVALATPFAGCVGPVVRPPQQATGPGSGASGVHSSMAPRDGTGLHGQRGTMMGPHYRQTTGRGTTTSLESWMSDVDNYTDIVDRTGRTRVTVAVGAAGNGGNFAYDPPVIRVSPGTTVRWEWTGQGGAHDVAFVDGSHSSRLVASSDASFERRFGRTGTYLYYCTPHQTLGMKGAVIVE